MKRPFPAVDFKDWNFDLNDVLQPIAVQVAKIMWDEMCEHVFSCIHIDEQGLILFWADEEMEMPLADFTLIRQTVEPWNGLDDMDHDHLVAYHKGTLAGIDLFEKWTAELRSDLPRIAAALRTSSEQTRGV